jgi:hypothetical protein
MRERVLSWGPQRSTGLVDVLDRALDKGLVIAGAVKISLAEVESWGSNHLSAENAELRRKVRTLERKVTSLTDRGTSAPPGARASRRGRVR